PSFAVVAGTADRIQAHRVYDPLWPNFGSCCDSWPHDLEHLWRTAGEMAAKHLHRRENRSTGTAHRDRPDNYFEFTSRGAKLCQSLARDCDHGPDTGFETKTRSGPRAIGLDGGRRGAGGRIVFR